jgi:hypothetical protein
MALARGTLYVRRRPEAQGELKMRKTYRKPSIQRRAPLAQVAAAPAPPPPIKLISGFSGTIQ